MPKTRVSEETCSLHPSSPVSLIGQEGGSESPWEMHHCLLETRRGETRAGLPAFSILTTERLGHPIPWPQWGHCLPVFPRSTWSSVQNKAPWDTPSQAQWQPSSPRFRHPHGQCPSCQRVYSALPRGVHGAAETRLCHQEGRWGWAPGSDQKWLEPLLGLPTTPNPPQPCSVLCFGCDSCTPTRGAAEVTCCRCSSPRSAPGACVSTPGLGSHPRTFPSVMSEPFVPWGRGLWALVPRPSGLRSRGSSPPPWRSIWGSIMRSLLWEASASQLRLLWRDLSWVVSAQVGWWWCPERLRDAQGAASEGWGHPDGWAGSAPLRPQRLVIKTSCSISEK